MPDDKSKRGGTDRERVAGGEGYEVEHFAEKHSISTEDAKRLIKEHGTDRAKLDAAATKLGTS
ncbi:MAG: hypothetical protein K0S56_87 [Microvirga sp.]|jgi:hypothetical protein|nr:hypothetical protein [Microvirga sp.]